MHLSTFYCNYLFQVSYINVFNYLFEKSCFLILYEGNLRIQKTMLTLLNAIKIAGMYEYYFWIL